MFQKARIKLTAWYLLIIMLVSLFFSLFIYQILSSELDRVDRIQRLRIERHDNLPDNWRFVDADILEETKHRLQIFLIIINLVILGGSALASYFLAGITLKPIANMLDEQKRFVDDASHELRTPLTVIKTEIEVAQRNKNLDLKSANRLLKSNLEEINKLKSLTDYFLILGKYQNASTPFPFEFFDLAKAIDKSCLNIGVLAKNKNIKINKNYQEEVNLNANKVSLIELFTIILDNAIKYSVKNNTINIYVYHHPHEVEIKIEDFGIGINKSQIPYIFNRFYRADTSRSKEMAEGYGLGLSIAKNIVDLHKGRIMVDSVLGKGSSFSVFLPI